MEMCDELTNADSEGLLDSFSHNIKPKVKLSFIIQIDLKIFIIQCHLHYFLY